ncbi:MAG: NAD(P)/FAD-dependent oxidoreductase [Planctomycetota bacterium]|jgi:phytoene dehydrogenase-like protein
MGARPPALIVGAGLAGLSCALRLHRAGVPVQVLEAQDGVGGRIRTDLIDGFRIDRGFQVLLTAYPEVQDLIDLEALDLEAFTPGALVQWGGRFHRIVDPFRHPAQAFAGALAPIGSLGDKLRVARLRSRVRGQTLEDLFHGKETTTADAFVEEGLGASMRERFLAPFYRGILLDPELRTSSRLFRFIFRMFAEGDAALPAGGMQRLPEQLAAKLPAGTVRPGVRVRALEDGAVVLEDGSRLEGAPVVVATEGFEARRLLDGRGDLKPGDGESWRGTACLSFDAPRSPVQERLLVLNGHGIGSGPVNHLAVPSEVQPSYAPVGRSLVSASVVHGAWPADRVADDALLERDVRELPDDGWAEQVAPSLFVCGDHMAGASIQGALRSGRRAAEGVLQARAAGKDLLLPAQGELVLGRPIMPPELP